MLIAQNICMFFNDNLHIMFSLFLLMVVFLAFRVAPGRNGLSSFMERFLKNMRPQQSTQDENRGSSQEHNYFLPVKELDNSPPHGENDAFDDSFFTLYS